MGATKIGAAAEVELTVNQWAGLDRVLVIYEEDDDGVETVRDLTGYTPTAEIRQTYDDATPLVANFASILSEEAALGKIRLKILHNVTAALNFDTAVWDLILDKTGQIRERLMQGNVVLSKGVSR